MITFVTVTNDTLVDFMFKAKNKIIVAKPALKTQEVDALERIVTNKNIMCKVYIESGDSAVRHGFGDVEALDKLLKGLDRINIQTVERIRLSIVIVDDTALMYGPNILFIDKDINEPSFPNGILIKDKRHVSEIHNMIVSEERIEEDKIVLFPGYKIENKRNETVKEELKDTKEKLHKNPPLDPGKLRRTSFYRDKYKIVKVEQKRMSVKDRRINLDNFKKYLGKKNENLKQSWNIIGEGQKDKIDIFKVLKKKIEEVNKKYSIKVGRYGAVIKVEDKENFQREMDLIKKDFEEYIKGTEKEKNMFYKHYKENNFLSDIKSILDESRNALKEYLMKMGKEDEKFIDNIVSKDIFLKMELERTEEDEKEKKQAEIMKDFINRFVENDLRFPTCKEMFEKLDIKIYFYDVSNELIEDKEFINKIGKFNIEFREYEEGHVEEQKFF